MDQSIRTACEFLSSVLNHAESSSRELADAVSQRPVHLEMARTSFLQKLEHRVEASAADLQHIESIALDTVSFEELLGHCGEALKVYARHADALQSHLASFGYEPPDAQHPEIDVDVEDGDVGKVGDPGDRCLSVSRSVLRSGKRRFDSHSDAIFEESLKDLGFSDACLATLSSEGAHYGESPKKLYKNAESTDDGEKIMNEAEIMTPLNERNGQGVIRASKEDYEQLPPYMKSLASWEGSVALNQDRVAEIGLGRKGRACLLMLLRLNQLTMETVDGSTFYTLCKNNV
uniref:Spindle and kinetochore-associated protein 3 n=1 Tax=Zea mays TaxID=4577 RepID=A0A804N4I9_MAIZE